MKDSALPFVELRAMEPEDLDTLYKIENDKEMWNVSTTNVPYSKYVLHQYIANATNDIYTDKQVRMIAIDDRGETVGIVDLVNFSPQHQRAELGIVVLKERQKQGFGKAIITKIIEYCRNVIHLHQIYGIVASDNISSIKLFNDLNFSEVVRLPHWLYDGKAYKDAIMMQFFL
jgi:diamine N-acetyltransferase